MTGDGVNDALALKDADIGVAMGNGAHATKAVAQLVLLDGKFSHLPAVLAQGRRVIGNVERVANLFLAKNVMSFFAILTAAGFALPFPSLPRQLTLVSALTIGIPAFFLALGPNTSRYLPGFLKRVLRFALPAGSIAGIVVIGSYLWARNRYGMSDGVPCSVSGQTAAPADVACWQPGTGATSGIVDHVLLDPGRAGPATTPVENRRHRIGGRHRGTVIRGALRGPVLQLQPAAGSVHGIAHRGHRRRRRRGSALPSHPVPTKCNSMINPCAPTPGFTAHGRVSKPNSDANRDRRVQQISSRTRDSGTGIRKAVAPLRPNSARTPAGTARRR